MSVTMYVTVVSKSGLDTNRMQCAINCRALSALEAGASPEEIKAALTDTKISSFSISELSTVFDSDAARKFIADTKHAVYAFVSDVAENDFDMAFNEVKTFSVEFGEILSRRILLANRLEMCGLDSNPLSLSVRATRFLANFFNLNLQTDDGLCGSALHLAYDWNADHNAWKTVMNNNIKRLENTDDYSDICMEVLTFLRLLVALSEEYYVCISWS